MIATACDVGGSFGPLGCSRHVVSAATRPTATTGENRVMREPMAHLWPGAYLPRRSRALEVGAGSGTNGTKLRRFAGQRKIVGRPAALPTTYVPSEGPMLQYTYLIVGGGMTADAAAQGIREVDANGTIGLVGAEPHPPYNRPPLSKALWKGEPEASIWRKTESTGATLQLGRRVVGVDPGAKTVTDDRGTIHGYKKLLLATGGTPRRLPLKSEQVIYFRTCEDYRRLRGLAEAPVRFAVIGGGFIGTEIAAALRLQGRDVTMLVPEDGLGARVFPADLARFLVDYYRQKGVELRMGEGMTGLEARAGKAVVRTTKNSQFTTDVIVAGLGIQPNVELAEQAGLRVDNGIVVDDLCRTSKADIYAAGDVATSTTRRSTPACGW